MSDEQTIGKIEITISGDEVQFSSNVPLIELNYWLDHVKYLIVSGQAQRSDPESS